MEPGCALRHCPPRSLPNLMGALLLRPLLDQILSYCLDWRRREFTSVDVGHFMPVALCGQEDFQICLIYKYKYSLIAEKACQGILQREKSLRQRHSNAVFQLAISLCCLHLFSPPQASHLLKVFLPCDASAYILISRNCPHATPPFSKEASGRTVICLSCFCHLLLRFSDYHASCCSSVKNIYISLP